jgi:hypothetical protein
MAALSMMISTTCCTTVFLQHASVSRTYILTEAEITPPLVLLR